MTALRAMPRRAPGVDSSTSIDFLEEAVRIGEELWGLRLESRKGEIAWLGPVGYGTENFPLRRVQVGAHLYHGTPGIALFFAALFRVTGEADQRDRALTTLAPLRRILRSLKESPERNAKLDIPVGGLIGSGSFVYSLLTAGMLLDDESLVDEARWASRLITRERVERDRKVRVQTGSAGAVLALVALHERDPAYEGPSPSPLDLAVTCGDHLVSQQAAFEDLPRAWPLSPGKPPLPGYCYGAAGICHALLKLHHHAPRATLLEAARQGLEFIRLLFSPSAGGWLDLREILKRRHPEITSTQWKDWWSAAGSVLPDGSHEVLTAANIEQETRNVTAEDCLAVWCHGAAGIALGRLASLDMLDHEVDRQQALAGLELIRSLAEPDRLGELAADDLCCGYMGLVETLARSSAITGDVSLAESARTLAARVVERARATSGYKLSAARGSDQDAPTLFQGLAGVGYTLLRLVRPDALPCLLLFE